MMARGSRGTMQRIEAVVSRPIAELLEVIRRRQVRAAANGNCESVENERHYLGQILEIYALGAYDDLFDSRALPYREFARLVEAGEKVDLARYAR